MTGVGPAMASGFSGRADQQQQSDRCDPSGLRFHGHVPYRWENSRKIQRAEVHAYQEDRQGETEIANAIYDKGLVAGVGRVFFQEVKADQ